MKQYEAWYRYALQFGTTLTISALQPLENEMQEYWNSKWKHNKVEQQMNVEWTQ